MGCQAHRYTSRVGFLAWFTLEPRMALPPRKPGIEGAGHRLRTFASAREFRAWLRAHHRSAAELLLRCYKVAAKDQGLTYREALDEALCFGWIDGVRRGVDAKSFSTRFTPRKARSTWSAINIKRAQELEAEGR